MYLEFGYIWTISFILLHIGTSVVRDARNHAQYKVGWCEDLQKALCAARSVSRPQSEVEISPLEVDIWICLLEAALNFLREYNLVLP